MFGHKNEKIPEIDTWRKAILAERESGSAHGQYLGWLEGRLDEIGSDNCLILGDAAQVVTSSLVEDRGFKHAVIVDNSPMLFDEYKIKKDDSRYERYKMDFHDYHAPKESFNLIYGKSIGFVRKDSIGGMLQELHGALLPNGVLVAVYGAEGDIFRPETYSKEELELIYQNAGFSKLFFASHQNPGLLEKNDKAHTIRVIAYK